MDERVKREGKPSIKEGREETAGKQRVERRRLIGQKVTLACPEEGRTRASQLAWKLLTIG